MSLDTRSFGLFGDAYYLLDRRVLDGEYSTDRLAFSGPSRSASFFECKFQRYTH